MPIIETKNLSYTYSIGTPFKKDAVKNVNISINKSEFIGIIGHTGSGKSTLMQTLNGLLKPSDGKIFIDGEDLWENPKKIRDIRFKVGLVFQYPEYQLFEDTVAKDIAFGPKNMNLSEDEIAQRVKSSAEFVGMNQELLKKSPFDLSGGEKRRAAIAGVIAMNPDILILDEPTAGLDPAGRDLILDQIRSYQQKQGSTVLLVTHSMEDVARIASRVLVMNKGEVAMFDTTEKVFAQGDKLKTMGLRVPQITQIFLELKKRGYPVSDAILSVEQGKVETLRLLSVKKEEKLC